MLTIVWRLYRNIEELKKKRRKTKLPNLYMKIEWLTYQRTTLSSLVKTISKKISAVHHE